MISGSTGYGTVQIWAEKQFEGQAFLDARAGGLIFRFLKAVGRPGTGVIIPSTTCHSVAFAVTLAGYAPVFADISLIDYNADAQTTAEAIDKSEIPVSVCIVVHAFGHLAESAAIVDACHSRGILVLEDICQILGSSDISSSADAVLGSFGYSKPIDVGGGGFLTLRNESLAYEMNHSQKLTEELPWAQEWEMQQFKDLYSGIRKISGTNPSVRSRITGLASIFPSVFLKGSKVDDVWDRVAGKLALLGKLVETRQARFNRFFTGINQDLLELPVIRDGSSPWRFTFMTLDSQFQEHLTVKLRNEIKHASNWYPSLNLDYQTQSTECRNSSYFEKRVINLWLDYSVTDTYIDLAIELINDFSTHVSRGTPPEAR